MIVEVDYPAFSIMKNHDTASCIHEMKILTIKEHRLVFKMIDFFCPFKKKRKMIDFPFFASKACFMNSTKYHLEL